MGASRGFPSGSELDAGALGLSKFIKLSRVPRAVAVVPNFPQALLRPFSSHCGLHPSGESVSISQLPSLSTLSTLSTFDSANSVDRSFSLLSQLSPGAGHERSLI